jgi:hypothetical protein
MPEELRAMLCGPIGTETCGALTLLDSGDEVGPKLCVGAGQCRFPPTETRPMSDELLFSI